MTRWSSLGRILGAAGAAILIVGMAPICVAGAGAASPKLTVTPSVNLKNKEVVKVSGKGFKAKDTVYLVECLSTASGQSQCNSMAAIPVTISAKGVLPTTKFTVLTGKIGDGTCGTKASNLKSCDVSAGNMSGGDSATAAITFAAVKK